MAGAKEIRTKIKSVQNTQKITRAMEMVAASKMRKAQERMRFARPYAERMRTVISHLAHAHPEYRHPYLLPREQVSRVGYLIVSTDRGLCGGLNVNLFKAAVMEMRKGSQQGIGLDVSVVGSKGMAFFKRLGATIVAEASHLGDAPHVEDLVGTVKVMLDAYNHGKIDKLVLGYNTFINTMTQRPHLETLLPIQPEGLDARLKHHWDYLYEPDSKEVLDELLMRYIESLVYQAVVENIACEQSARMVSMKSASDNAGNLIDELQLAYNKARQAAITQEISEIVGGAAAL